jgi:hypothetical protein
MIDSMFDPDQAVAAAQQLRPSWPHATGMRMANSPASRAPASGAPSHTRTGPELAQQPRSGKAGARRAHDQRLFPGIGMRSLIAA